ncbi:hypothetical protein L5515_001840 [Caenorhabditis briggsae]|uniref:polynucleotide adenylyltransferase n=1 Tax=Caenorhabditis briggsae TaxID=6238 RepID=A0AAE9E6Z6_CAEBR|nr:hypothetical protein L5515_001840 [Caenorhabditis briggsae]
MANDVLEYIKFLERVSPQVKSQHQPSGLPIQNEREASASMEALKALQYQQQWQHHMTRGVFLPQFVYTTIDNQMRQLKNRDHQSQHQHSHLQRAPSFDGEFPTGKELRKRDSSNDSQCSSEANPNEIPQMMEKLDADLDKTPVVDEEGIRRSRKNVANSGRKDHRKMNELPRKTNRRDSICSNASSASDVCSPVLDESTLTKVYPNEEFREGPGLASPSPPAALLSEPLSRMDVLSEKIWDYHNKVSQTDEMLQRKLHLRDMLYTAISPVFPLSGLYVVGSSLNGFGNNSSDMDLCLMITNKDLDQKNDAVVVLNLILSTLQYEKFVASQKLILAKVPILRIKFAAPFDDITVDLNANNSVAIRNTHLLCYYSSYDWRVRPLVSVVKEWAKRKGINDANKSSFTSYSLVLMVIHYLQCGTEARVLPNLQQSYPTRFSNKVDVRTLNVTMPLEPVQDDIDPSLSENTTLGELLIGFLDYYANEFNYDRDAISIRQGKRVERAALAVRPKVHLSSEGEKEAPLPSSSASSSSVHNGIGVPMHHSLSNPHFWRSQWRCVCIEEPFTNSNTAHSIYDEMVFGAIKEAFREAHSELQDNRDLDRLLECEPIKASTTNAGAAVFAATYEGERPSAQQPTSIASASLRTMNVVPTPAGGGHYHYQQQSSQQVLKQQRSGNNQSYPSSNNRSSNSNQQQNRRVYNSQSAFNGSGSRPSKSSDSLKDSTSNSQQSHRQHHHNQRSNAGSTKENIALTSGATSSTDRKNSTSKKDEGSRTKRSSMIQSPEPTKAKTEKTATTQKKESQ